MDGKTEKQNFNNQAEAHLANRMKGYNLTTEEKAQIWQIVADRNEQINASKEYYKNNSQELNQKEYLRLKAQEKPQPQLNMTHNPTDYSIMARQAEINVINRGMNERVTMSKTADKNINAIFQQAKEREKQQNPDMQHDFQNAHDNNRQRDRA